MFDERKAVEAPAGKSNKNEKMEFGILDKLGAIFDAYDDSEKRIDAIMKWVVPYMRPNEMDLDLLVENIESAGQAQNRNDFASKMLSALVPIAEYQNKNPEHYAQIAQENFARNGDLETVNEVFKYGKSEDGWLHVHIAPSIGALETLRLVRSGLAKLAEMTEQDAGIEGLTATSWLVAHNPSIMEKLGFTVDGEISPEEKKRRFPEEPREVWSSHISRENLLNRYLN